MGFLDTIEKPWKHPVDYVSLVFFFVIFVIVAFAMFDGMRILGGWVRSSASA